MYEVVPNWPKPLTSLPGHEKLELPPPPRVRREPEPGVHPAACELPNMTRPAMFSFPQLGPNIEFPNFRLPWRDATVASLPPGARAGRQGRRRFGRRGSPATRSTALSSRQRRPAGRLDAVGSSIHRRPPSRSARTTPRNASGSSTTSCTRFSCSARRQTAPADARRNERAWRGRQAFRRPTFIAWLPDGTFLLRTAM